MDHKTFLTWLADIDRLSDAQKAEVLAALDGGGPAGAMSIMAIEQAVGEDRTCPHCGTAGAVANGHNKGLQRYRCKGCKRTFNALSRTPLSKLAHRDRWLEFSQCMADGDTVAASAARCGIHPSTAFRWRHRFLAAVKSGAAKLKGIVEADETFVLLSKKGNHMSRDERRRAKEAAEAGSEPPERKDRLGRKPRKRGGKAAKPGISDEQVPVLVAADRSGATLSVVLPEVTAAAVWSALKHRVAADSLLVTDAKNVYPPVAKILQMTHEALNQSAGERVRGDLHINTVNNRHSRLKDFLRARRGIATRHLGSYLKWFHLIGLHADPTPRYCLAAAMGA